MEWLNNHVQLLNKEKNKENIFIKLAQSERSKINKQVCFNAGYLFSQKIYYSLGINNICNEIKDKYQFHYDLNNILSNLIYSRIIYPLMLSLLLKIARLLKVIITF